MTDDEYRKFLSFLFERYMRPHIPRVRSRYRHHMEDEWSYHLGHAQRAFPVFRYIENNCDDDDDVYGTFTLERLGRAVSNTRYSLNFSNNIAERSGFLDAFETYARDILNGLEPHHLPDADKDVLREMGIPNPEMEIEALILLAKTSRDRWEHTARDVSIRQQLRDIEKRLERAEKDFEEMKQAQKETNLQPKMKKSRRWFMGLGKIGQGAALSIANVALAVGALNFPVSPETRTWGVIASVATGVGTILGGVGDLRNE